MAEHTPGPWAVYDGPNEKRELTVQHADRGGQLVEVADCDSAWVPPDERHANALLIATAPDLLNIVTELAYFEFETARRQNSYEYAIQALCAIKRKARSAIDKATGQ